ncbi:MAG: hypothetical protein R2681_10105 [Pyrinomonadaceae bacterium]
MEKEDLEFEFKYEFAEPTDIQISNLEGFDSEPEHDGWYRRNRSILKQAFFYFPGVFLLLIYSAGFTYNIFYLGSLPTHFGLYLMTVISILFCIFGLGSLREPKHLAIPAGVCFVGLLMGIANIIGVSLTGKFWFVLDDGWSLLFLPFALMAGFLAKYLVDGSSE